MRAAMVEDPAHYRWTSYRTNALGQASALITPHALYRALGASDRARLARGDNPAASIGQAEFGS